MSDLAAIAARIESACRDLLAVSLYANGANLGPDQEQVRRRYRDYLHVAGRDGPTRAECLQRARREVVEMILQQELSK